MAKSTIPVDQYDFRPATGQTDQALTVDNTAGGVQLTAYPDGVTHVYLTITAASAATAMVTLDGSAPTASNGHPFASGYAAIWPASWARAAKFIRSAATDLTVHVSPLTASGVA